MKLYLLGALLGTAASLKQQPLRESTKPSGTAHIEPFDKDFQSFVELSMSKWHVPGFSISFSNDSVTLAQGFGTAIFPDTQATAETLYYTGSTTKSFTAATILRLIEQSQNSSRPIDLQTRISSLIKDDFVLQDTYTTEHATLEDALSHRTGMPRHEGSYGGPNFTVETMVRHLRYLPLTAELRSEFQYCNMMFVVLGYVAEVLTGSWLGELLYQFIWKPLGMTSTFFQLSDAQRAEMKGRVTLARGYYYNESAADFVPQEWLISPESAGAGMIISNVLDYNKYLRAILHKDETILSENSFNELRKSRTIMKGGGDAPYSGPTTYGLGWEMATFRGLQIYHHGGSVPGFGALMLYLPSKNWTMALMGNTDVNSNVICDLIAYEYLGRLLEVPKEERFNFEAKWEGLLAQMTSSWDNARDVLYPSAPPPDRSSKPSLKLASYTGTYHDPGYQNVTLALHRPPNWWAGSEEVILHADVTDKTWKVTMDFEHVNGEYFIARAWPMQSNPTKVFEKSQVFKAEFRIGEDGQVAELGLAVEAAMKGQKIWFKKIV